MSDIWPQGRLRWSKDIKYWLSHSMPVGFQNQSTVWFLGGDRITFTGYKDGFHWGKKLVGGTFDGQGQAWYDFVKDAGNYPNRPMGLTIW
jgi:galacturan 1,4-alpha-galacturonidase